MTNNEIKTCFFICRFSSETKIFKIKCEIGFINLPRQNYGYSFCFALNKNPKKCFFFFTAKVFIDDKCG